MFVKHGACGAQQENLGHPVKVLQTIFHVYLFYSILREPALKEVRDLAGASHLEEADFGVLR